MVRRSHNPQFYRILNVGKDISLLSTRANLLTQAGYTSDVVLEMDHAIRRIKVRRYHLVIVGPSFSADEQLAIRATLKQVRHDLPVLLLDSEQDNPEVLLPTVAQCLKRHQRVLLGAGSHSSRNDRKIN